MGIGTTEQWIVLKPGEQGYYDATRKTLSQQTVDVNYYTAWKDGVFAFYRQPLEEVMKTLGRWYLFDTHYQNEALKSILYTGKIYRHKRKGGYCQEKIKKATASSCTRTGCKLV